MSPCCLLSLLSGLQDLEVPTSRSVRTVATLLLPAHTHLTRAPPIPLRIGASGAGAESASLSGNSLPFGLSLLSAERWPPAGPGVWEPGRLGRRLPLPVLPSSLPPDAAFSFLYLPLLVLPRDPGPRGPRALHHHPHFPGGDSRLRVTGAWPLPPSLPAGERHSPPPLPTGRRRRRTSARGAAQRGRGYLPPISPPPVLIDLTLSLERWGDWERAPRPPFTYRRVL